MGIALVRCVSLGLPDRASSRTSGKVLEPEQKLLRLFLGLAHKWTSDKVLVPEQKLLRNFLVWHTKSQVSQNGIFPIPFIPPMRFIIFIMPPPFIFFIMSCICSNSLSMRLTSCT